MPVDREETLKKAEKLLKQGKPAAAIGEYVRLVEDYPGDWNSANALGDLYLKAGQAELAAEQFTRAADHLYEEGFLPRASALYKKVLKVRSADDHALWHLADISVRNRLSLDARSYYNRLVQDRRAAGNERGAIECVIRLGQLEDATVEEKRAAARALADRDGPPEAANLMPDAAETLDGQDEAESLDSEFLAVAPSSTPPASETPPTEERDEAGAVDDYETELERMAVDPSVMRDEIVLPDPDPAEPLPLESFFEELREKVARDREGRAREQLERGLRRLLENRPAEALTNLEEAARHPVLRFEASSRVARIYLDRGDLKNSVEWMERALEAPAPAAEDRLSIMYDLADTLASQGEAARAMAIFMELESDASGYRDVRDRLARLSRNEVGKR